MSSINKNNKVLVILGPTSGGKTGLAVKLALKFDGEVVSADSRQVYKGMDIGTGKDLAEYVVKSKVKSQRSRVVPYHLIDVADPKKQFDLAKYQKLAFEAIDDILSRGKLPIVAGGSGLYLQAIADSYRLSNIGENKKLRKELEKLDAQMLFKKLLKLNKKFAEKLNDSDKKNKRRLIRYIEINLSKQLSNVNCQMSIVKYDFLIIGLNWPRQILCERIYQRLVDRLEKEDLVGEIKRLHQEGLSWKRLESFGLEYKFVSQYLQKKMSYEETVEKLNIAIRQFAKRQMSWFRRWERQGRKILWLKKPDQAEKVVEKFLK